MANKRVFITGASKGIGAQIAKDLVSLGYHVDGTSRNTAAVSNMHPEVTYYDLDLSKLIISNEVNEAISQADILINNAGISQVGALAATPDEAFEELINVNFMGAVRCAKIFLKSRATAGSGGMIINIGSLASLFPLPYYTAYAASKAALLNFSLALSQEAKAVGVHVAAIDPHDIKTSIKPSPFPSDFQPWQAGTDRMAKSVASHMKKASDPVVVSQTVQKILNSPKPKPYYASGKNSWFLLLIRRLVSTKTLLRQIQKNYGFKD